MREPLSARKGVTFDRERHLAQEQETIDIWRNAGMPPDVNAMTCFSLLYPRTCMLLAACAAVITDWGGIPDAFRRTTIVYDSVLHRGTGKIVREWKEPPDLNRRMPAARVQ